MEKDMDDNRTLVDRSESRGREGYTSTGIGGYGNIRRTSLSRDFHPDSGPDDIQTTRASPRTSPLRRTPSEQEVVDTHNAANKDAPRSTGRGGLGNISRSRSRGHAVAEVVHSTGRGGMGNIKPGDPVQADILDEEERKKLGQHEGIHSTCRGGAANLTSANEPAIEHHGHSTAGYASTGRGGSANIVRDSSVDRT